MGANCRLPGGVLFGQKYAAEKIPEADTTEERDEIKEWREV